MELLPEGAGGLWRRSLYFWQDSDCPISLRTVLIYVHMWAALISRQGWPCGGVLEFVRQLREGRYRGGLLVCIYLQWHSPLPFTLELAVHDVRSYLPSNMRRRSSSKVLARRWAVLAALAQLSHLIDSC